MNNPAHPVAAPPLAYPDYRTDGYGWAMAQAAIIRAGRIDSIDWENVAEEIESVARTERSKLRRHLVQLLIHIMKWDVQPERRGRSWYHSIINHRFEALDTIEENPSLKPELENLYSAAMTRARRLAAQETDLPEAQFASYEISLQDAFERHFERPEGD